MSASDKFKEGLAALESLLDDEFFRIFRESNNLGCEGVAGAPIKEKYSVFCTNLENWTERLSVLIEEAFEKYTALAVANSQFTEGEAIEWIEALVRQFLEPRLGHRMTLPSSPNNSSVSFAESVTGGQKAHKWITYWVAEVSEGEGQDLGHSVGEGDWEFDDVAVDSWQAPAWLVNTTSQQSLESRLDAKTTAPEVGLIHFELWTKLEAAIEHARLRATVDVAVSTDSAVEPDLQQSESLRVYEAAKIANVNPRTITRWAREPNSFPVIWNKDETRIKQIPTKSFLEYLKGKLKNDS